MALAIMAIINHHTADNGNVDVYTSDYLLGSTPDSVPDQYNTWIKSISNDYMYQVLIFFHSEHDDDIFYPDLRIL